MIFLILYSTLSTIALINLFQYGYHNFRQNIEKEVENAKLKEHINNIFNN